MTTRICSVFDYFISNDNNNQVVNETQSLSAPLLNNSTKSLNPFDETVPKSVEDYYLTDESLSNNPFSLTCENKSKKITSTFNNENEKNFFFEDSIKCYTDEEMENDIREEQLKHVKKLAQDMSNINDMMQMIGGLVEKDTEQLNEISNRVNSTNDNIENSLKNIEETVVLKSSFSKKKIIIGTFLGLVIGGTFFGPVGTLIGLKIGIIIIISGTIGSGVSGGVISAYCC